MAELCDDPRVEFSGLLRSHDYGYDEVSAGSVSLGRWDGDAADLPTPPARQVTVIS